MFPPLSNILHRYVAYTSYKIHPGLCLASIGRHHVMKSGFESGFMEVGALHEWALNLSLCYRKRDPGRGRADRLHQSTGSSLACHGASREPFLRKVQAPVLLTLCFQEYAVSPHRGYYRTSFRGYYEAITRG